MKAEIKYLHSPDIVDLKAFVPEVSDCFSFLLQMMVGEKDKIGEESFDILICTPKWLSSHHTKSDIILGRHYLIMFEYNYNGLYDYLKSLVDKVSGENWKDIALELSTIGLWEFENYSK